MPTYKVQVDVVNRVAADRYYIELYKQTSNIFTAAAILQPNSGINSHTFIDLVNDSYRVRLGHECAEVVIWTDKFPVNTSSSGSANTQCKKPTAAPTGGVGQVSIAVTVDSSQGIETQVFRNPIVSDPPSSINSDGKVLVKAAYFAAPVVSPVIVTGLAAGAYFLKTRAACNVTAYNSTGGSSMVVIYSDWANYEAFTVT